MGNSKSEGISFYFGGGSVECPTEFVAETVCLAFVPGGTLSDVVLQFRKKPKGVGH
jgi:hypothetical protein